MHLINGLDVSRETFDRLKAFEQLVVRWSPKINLVARSQLADLWERHIIDSAQLFPLAPSFNNWIDIGSGGGFPGIVTAIISAEQNPLAQFRLIESDQRKAAFLRTAIATLDLNTAVISERIEAVQPQNGDIVSARALGSLSTLLPLCKRHLSIDGTSLLMKGEHYRKEIIEAQLDWDFDLKDNPSITNPTARILSIQRIFRVA